HRAAPLAGVQRGRLGHRGRRGAGAAGGAAPPAMTSGPSRSFVAHQAGRLDAVAAAALGVPRADVQRAIEGGRVSVDGRVRPKSFRLSGGELVRADLPSPFELEPDPEPVPVRYEDEDLLVVAKPAGMVVHPTASRRTGTLVNR